MSDQLNIEVVYALPQQQTVIALRVAPETCVLAAIEQSGIVQNTPRLIWRSTSSVSTAAR